MLPSMQTRWSHVKLLTAIFRATVKKITKEVKQGHLIEIFDFHLEDVRLVNFI